MMVRKDGILADLAHRAPSKRRLTLIAALCATSLLGVVAATAVVPGQDAPPSSSRHILEHLGTPEFERLPGSDLPYVFDEFIQPGDTIVTLFRRVGIEDREAMAFISSDDQGREALRRLRAGRAITGAVTADGSLLALSLPVAGSSERFAIERGENGLAIIETDASSYDTMVEMRSGTIRHSLFGATDSAGVPDSIASRFAEIFGTQIDFSRDLRQGDRFSVIYETSYDNGTPVGTGRILAAEFENRGETHTVILHRESDGSENYYTPDGRGLNQAFLRYPLEFTRISSSFGRRMHPIHRNWRNHNGTDFAAPTGTPIMASSDGRIEFIGAQRGYGNTVIIQHRDNYSTLYAHLNGFPGNLARGQRVRQGDLIGYVGMTGWATGPHLHYEIRINNVPHDPMKIALPEVEPLEKEALARFQDQAATPMLERLAMLNYRPAQLAAAQIEASDEGAAGSD